MTKKKNQSERLAELEADIVSRTTFGRIGTACDLLKDTLQRKNSDYGDSAFREPLMCPGMTPGAAIMVRMSDKINRIVTLEQWNAVADKVDDFTCVSFKKTEPLADSYLDLAGYALLRWISLQPEEQDF